MLEILKTVYAFCEPFATIRFLLKKNLQSVIKNNYMAGSLIDIGCGSMPYRHLFPRHIDYRGIDYNQFSKYDRFSFNIPDFFFDLNYEYDFRLPFSDNAFNIVVCFQVLEHHSNAEILVSECARICSHHGTLIFTTPFISGIHESPNDYVRYTKFGLRKLFEDQKLKVSYIKENGGLFSAIFLLINETWSLLYSESRLHTRLFLFLIYPLLLSLSYLAIILDLIWPSDTICPNYIICAIKD